MDELKLVVSIFYKENELHGHFETISVFILLLYSKWKVEIKIRLFS